MAHLGQVVGLTAGLRCLIESHQGSIAVMGPCINLAHECLQHLTRLECSSLGNLSSVGSKGFITYQIGSSWAQIGSYEVISEA